MKTLTATGTIKSASSRWSRRQRQMIEHLLAPLEKAEQGRLTLRLPTGDVLHFGKEDHPGPQAKVELKRWAALRRTVTGGSLGWSESYLDGDWDSPDIACFIEWVLSNEKYFGGQLLKSGLIKSAMMRLRHRLHANSKRNSKRNISFHYDLGNRFYQQWLDTSMTYSSALYKPEELDDDKVPLALAQKHKYQAIIDTLDIRDGASVLEIGCGWGGFAEQLASQRDVRIDGITLSERQLDFARERLAKSGLDTRARFSLTDYRDTQGEYDHIVSIEMLEAVGQEYWPTYFETVYQRLKPGGTAAIQVITIADDRFDGYRSDPDYIQTYIFPGGMLPSPTLLHRGAEQAGLLISSENTFGLSYARTLREWDTRFHAAWPEIAPLGFDQRFKRMWHYYLAYCEGGFRAGSIDVCHLFLQRPTNA